MVILQPKKKRIIRKIPKLVSFKHFQYSFIMKALEVMKVKATGSIPNQDQYKDEYKRASIYNGNSQFVMKT